MDARKQRIWDALVCLNGETVLGLMTDYHGIQLLDEGFEEYLIDEGYLDPEPDDEEADEDDEEEDEE